MGTHNKALDVREYSICIQYLGVNDTQNEMFLTFRFLLFFPILWAISQPTYSFSCYSAVEVGET